MPPPAPGQRTLEVLTEHRVSRGADGLIELVDGRRVDDYVRDVARDRADQFRAAREAGRLSRARIGPVSSVALDRRTGHLMEGTNGRDDAVIGLDDLHPALGQRLRQLEDAGPYPATNRDGTIATWTDGTPAVRTYPHPDNPLRHAEVKAVNDLLVARGPGADTAAMRELMEHNMFLFDQHAPRAAPCCANCSALLHDVPSGSGRFISFPGTDGGYRPR
jgi:hypothetical protein